MENTAEKKHKRSKMKQRDIKCNAIKYHNKIMNIIMNRMHKPRCSTAFHSVRVSVYDTIGKQPIWNEREGKTIISLLLFFLFKIKIFLYSMQNDALCVIDSKTILTN